MSISRRLTLAACAAFVVPAAFAAPEEWQVTVDRHATPLVESGLVPGLVIGMYKDGETGFYALGTLTPDGDKAPTADTLYEIGSITKVFTATLLAEANRRGEAGFDDPISKFLPEGVEAPTRDGVEVTLKHLATHTSGFPRLPPNIDLSDMTNPYAAYSEDDLWEGIESTTLLTTPGETYAYSNYATGLLGTIVANVSRSSYERLLEKRIFRPVGMATATVTLDPVEEARLAPPHLAGGKPDHNWDFQALAGAGAIRASARDMMKFAERVLHPKGEALDEAIESTIKPIANAGDAPYFYAIGWHVAGDGSTLWHGGQTGGYHAALFVSRPLDAAVVLLTNAADGTASAVAEKLVQTLAGVDPEPIVLSSDNVTEEELERLVGVYASPVGIVFHITRQAGILMARVEGQGPLRLWPDSPTEFHYREVDARVTFEVEGNGPAKALTLFQGGREFKCERR